MKVAIVGDSFLDVYIFGKVKRVSPEAPVPVLDVERKEIRGGGAINVANNLLGLGIEPVVFTITTRDYPFKVVSPQDCTPLLKTRFIGNGFQLLRVDEPPLYKKEDLKKMIYPKTNDFDLVAFVDYDKGIIKGGRATIVDSKKKDLSVFKGSEYLKVNKKEFFQARGKNVFKKIFVTEGEEGISYFENGKLKYSEPAQAKEVIDVTGAGDTVTAVVIYCLAKGIKDPQMIMRLANKAAGIVINKFGTSIITEEELFY